MFRKLLLIVSMCNFVNCSQVKKESVRINLGEVDLPGVMGGQDDSKKSLSEGHHNHWGSEKHVYNEQHRERLPEALIHHASTSIVTPRLDVGVIDLPGVPRVVSDDSNSPPRCKRTVVNVAATIAVKTESDCCNSHCCIDEDTTCSCAIQ